MTGGKVLLAAASLAFASAAFRLDAGTAALAEDRLALADRLFARGMYAQALKEYESLRGEKSLAADDVLYRLGEAHIALGDKQKAAAVFRELTSLSPDSPLKFRALLRLSSLVEGDERTKLLRRLGASSTPQDIRIPALYRLGLVLEAENTPRSAAECRKIYETLAAAGGNGAYAEYGKLRLAAILASSKDPKETAAATRYYTELASSSNAAVAEEALYFKGRLELSKGDAASAAKIFGELAKRFPGGKRVKDASLCAAWSEFKSMHYKEALESLSRAGGSEEALYLKGAVYKELSDNANAVEAWSEQLSSYPTGKYASDAWFGRLGARFARGDRKGVLADMADESKIPPAYLQQALWIGGQSAAEEKNLPLAVEYLKRLSSIPDAKMLKEASYMLAWSYSGSGSTNEAVNAYHSFAEKWPNDELAPKAMLASADLLDASGRTEESFRDLGWILAKHPKAKESADALYRRMAGEFKAKKFKAAASSAEEFASRFPGDQRIASVLYFLGSAHSANGEKKAAENAFRQCLEKKPPQRIESEVKVSLAQLLKDSGRDDESAALFVSAIDTPSAARMPPPLIAWLCGRLVSLGRLDDAMRVANELVSRNAGGKWNQAAEAFKGRIHELRHETDAAAAAYDAALKYSEPSRYWFDSALSLSSICFQKGDFKKARNLARDAVSRTASSSDLSKEESAAFRVKAYLSLASIEEEDPAGSAAEALEYNLIVATLFDDPEMVPQAMRNAARLLRSEGRLEEAAGLENDLKKRYPEK